MQLNFQLLGRLLQSDRLHSAAEIAKVRRVDLLPPPRVEMLWQVAQQDAGKFCMKNAFQRRIRRSA